MYNFADFNQSDSGHSRPRKVIIEAPDGRIICNRRPINITSHRSYPRYEISLSYNIYTEVSKDTPEQILKGVNSLLPGIYKGGDQKLVLKKINKVSNSKFNTDLYYLRFISNINILLAKWKRPEFLPFHKLTNSLPGFIVADRVTIGTFEFIGVNDLQYLKRYLYKEYDQ